MLRHERLEARFVILHLWLVCESCAQLAEDSGEVCIGRLSEAIVSPLAIAARGDEAGAAEVRKVPRDLWLIGPENFDTRADAQFIVAQQMNEPQAGVVSKCSEDQFQFHCRNYDVQGASVHFG